MCETTTGMNPSLAGVDDAHEYYYRCKRSRNDRLVQSLPPATRKRVAALRDALDGWEDAYIGMSEAVAGGGSMYGHWAARAPATREEALGTVVTALAEPASTRPATRTAANQAFEGLRNAVRRLAKPDLDGLTAADRRDYWRSYKEWKRATGRLRAVVASLPVAAADQIGDYVTGVKGEGVASWRSYR